MDVLEQILDLARWAPSGDNTQPWRFEVLSDEHVVIHGFDTREHCVYDVEGHPSQMALGALLETLGLAASGHGLRVEASRRLTMPDTRPTFDVRLVAGATVRSSDLIPYITTRTVQRRPLSTRPLTLAEKAELEAAVSKFYSVFWLEDFAHRWQVARLMFANAKLRLTLPEAYAVHRSVIEWNTRFSEDKVPDQAVGLDPLATKLMRWVMGSWERVQFFNTYLAGTVLPRIEMDLLPGLACAAHFVLIAATEPRTVDDYVAAGGAMQRFWLTATRLGLHVQPEMTPLIFAAYVRADRRCTSDDEVWLGIQRLKAKFEEVMGADTVAHSVFMGRIGAGRGAEARSLRLPLAKLMEMP